jgi:hypothetical protein
VIEMKRQMLRVVGLIVLSACLGLTSRRAAPAVSPAQAMAVQPHISIAHLPPEVRLRKLHLVRPDLIQYPILYEVYC